jgi:hypothetical protein
MQPKMAKEKPNEEEFGGGPCVNPTIGETRVMAYINREMSDAEHQNFVAHVAECKFCLEEIVLWRTAEELVGWGDRLEEIVPRRKADRATEREDRPRQVAETA